LRGLQSRWTPANIGFQKRRFVPNGSWTKRNIASLSEIQGRKGLLFCCKKWGALNTGFQAMDAGRQKEEPVRSTVLVTALRNPGGLGRCIHSKAPSKPKSLVSRLSLAYRDSQVGAGARRRHSAFFSNRFYYEEGKLLVNFSGAGFIRNFEAEKIPPSLIDTRTLEASVLFEDIKCLFREKLSFRMES